MSDEIDLEKHLVNDDTDRVEIEHKDDLLWFDLKELSWADKQDIVDDNKTVESDGNVDVNLSGLQKDILKERIVDSNVPNIPIFVEKMPDKVGEELMSYVDDPVSDNDEGN